MEEFYHPAARHFDKKAAREDFSCIGWAFAAFLLISQGIATLLALGVRAAAAAGSGPMQNFLGSEWFVWVVSDASTYLVGLPVLLLLLRGVPAGEAPKKKRVSPKQFGALVLVSYAALYCSNLIGLVITNVIGLIRGEAVANPLENVILGSNPWITLLFVVIIAPIAEEFVFRGVLLRRLLPYGEPLTILATALLFGLFHANLSQLPYAFAIGAIFAYVAIRTGSLLWSILLHAILNFVGSVLSLLVMETESVVVSALFGFVILAVVIGGVVVFWKHRKMIHLRKGPLPLPEREKRELFFKSGGVIAFFVVSGILILVSLL